MNKKFVLIFVCLCIVFQNNGNDAFVNKFLTSGKLKKDWKKPDAEDLLLAQNRQFKMILERLREAKKQLAWKVFMMETKNDIKPLFIG